MVSIALVTFVSSLEVPTCPVSTVPLTTQALTFDWKERDNV